MPNGGYGVYADKFKTVKTKDGKTKRQRIMTPGGQHAKELKKVYKNEKDANDYMAAIMIAKRWWMKSFRNFELREENFLRLRRTVLSYAPSKSMRTEVRIR